MKVPICFMSWIIHWTIQPFNYITTSNTLRDKPFVSLKGSLKVISSNMYQFHHIRVSFHVMVRSCNQGSRHKTTPTNNSDCTYNNGTTTGVKCNGTDACANVTDMSGIGCGSWWVAFSVIDPSFYPNTHACTVLLQQWQWCVYICRWAYRGEQLVSVFFMEKVNMSLYSYTNVLTTLLQQWRWCLFFC